jgi:hypothetical protein
LVPEGKINTTDRDSGVMIQQGQPPIQDYNAQPAVTTNQIIVTAQVTTTAPDYGQLGPVVDAALGDLRQAGVTQRPVTVLADAGYWHKEQIERIVTDGMQVLIPPDSGLREGARPGWEGGSTRSCAACSQATAAGRSTASASTAWSRCSVRSKATDGSTASNEEAAARSGPSGD